MAIALTYDRKAQRDATPRPRPVVYPTGDGKPMAETDVHVNLIVYHIGALRLFFTDDNPAYVAGNNFLYYEEGNPKARLSPDTYVVLGASPHLRNSYKVWEEGGRVPAIVFEFTSKGTRDEDMGRKFTLYEQTLEVPEYILFDPTGDYLSPRLQGYRLQNGRYAPIPLLDGRMPSEQLGLELVVEGERLRLYDPVAGRFLPNAKEADALRAEATRAQLTAEAARDAERQTRLAAEGVRDVERQARLEAERDRDTATQARLEAEAARAVESQARLEADARRAETEAENARLRAALAASRAIVKPISES